MGVTFIMGYQESETLFDCRVCSPLSKLNNCNAALCNSNEALLMYFLDSDSVSDSNRPFAFCVCGLQPVLLNKLFKHTGRLFFALLYVCQQNDRAINEIGEPHSLSKPISDAIKSFSIARGLQLTAG